MKRDLTDLKKKQPTTAGYNVYRSSARLDTEVRIITIEQLDKNLRKKRHDTTPAEHCHQLTTQLK